MRRFIKVRIAGLAIVVFSLTSCHKPETVVSEVNWSCTHPTCRIEFSITNRKDLAENVTYNIRGNRIRHGPRLKGGGSNYVAFNLTKKMKLEPFETKRVEELISYKTFPTVVKVRIVENVDQ